MTSCIVSTKIANSLLKAMATSINNWGGVNIYILYAVLPHKFLLKSAVKTVQFSEEIH